MRKLRLAVVSFALVVAFPLAALAQDEAGAVDTGDAISVAATVAVVSGGIAWIVEWLRKRFPVLDGDIVRVLSLALALGAVYAWDLRIAADFGYAGLPDLLDAIVSGVIVAGGAGAIGSWKNVQRSQDPTSSIHSEAVHAHAHDHPPVA